MQSWHQLLKLEGAQLVFCEGGESKLPGPRGILLRTCMCSEMNALFGSSFRLDAIICLVLACPVGDPGRSNGKINSRPGTPIILIAAHKVRGKGPAAALGALGDGLQRWSPWRVLVSATCRDRG